MALIVPGGCLNYTSSTNHQMYVYTNLPEAMEFLFTFTNMQQVATRRTHTKIIMKIRTPGRAIATIRSVAGNGDTVISEVDEVLNKGVGFWGVMSVVSASHSLELQ